MSGMADRARRRRRSATSAARVSGFAAALLLLDACTNRLPTEPSELTAGIVIYQDANFLGRSAHVTSDMRNLRDVDGPCRKSDGETDTNSWDDCVSSVRVAPGWRATLYEDPNFKGWAADVGDENVSNYQLVRGPCTRDTFNDCASSVRVYRR
jgi:Peptidase inhibitor family I36